MQEYDCKEPPSDAGTTRARWAHLGQTIADANSNREVM